MSNLISCRPESFGPYRDRAYPTLQSLGVSHVEITVPAPDQIAQTRDELEQYGLSAASLGFYTGLAEPGFLAGVEQATQAAVALGARVLFSSQRAGDGNREEVFARLRQAGDIAGAAGVSIALETHPDLCENARTALETMRALNHPNVGLNFDPANIYYYNHNIDAVQELQQVLPYVRAVHLKDSSGGFHDHDFPPIGEGVVQWPALFHALQEGGVDVPFTLEMEGPEGQELSFEETYDRIRRSLHFLRSKSLIA